MRKTLEDRIFKLEAVNEVQRLIGLYSSYMTLKSYDSVAGLFAQDYPDVHAEMLWGRYLGKEGVDRLYRGYYEHLGEIGEETALLDSVQSMEVPVITVAEDLKTAKGVWVSPGYILLKDDCGKQAAYWSWQKYGCDFIYTQSGWRIWHLRVYGLFEAEYGTPTVFPSGTFGTDSAMAEFAPDEPPTSSFNLSPKSINPYAPAIPKPYFAFDGDYSY